MLSNVKQNKRGASTDSGIDLERSVQDKYDIEISRRDSLNDSAKTLGGGKLTKALQHLPMTNQLSANNSLQHRTELMRKTNVRPRLYELNKKIQTKLTRNANLRHKGIRKSLHEEQMDNTINIQSMDLKLEWMKISEEKRLNEEDKLMLQKQRKLLEQQQMELEQEKIKLVFSKNPRSVFTTHQAVSVVQYH